MLTGTIHDIISSKYTVMIVLEECGVGCNILKSQEDNVSTLSKGDKVSLIGIVGEMEFGTPTLNDCIIR